MTHSTVYISDIGSFYGRYIAEWLYKNLNVEQPPKQDESQQNRATSDDDAASIDAELEAKEEEEDDHEEMQFQGPWRIVGSVREGDTVASYVWHTEPVGTTKAAKLAQSAQHIVLSLRNQPDESSAIIGLLRDENEEKKVLIGVSSLRVWELTKIKGQTDGFSEEDYRKRTPSEDLRNTLTLETHLQSLSRENLRVHIVGHGILYGQEEHTLHQLFKEAWLCETNTLTVPSTNERDGKHKLPMIHVEDFAAIIGSVLSNEQETEYIVACDDAQITLKELCLSISQALGPGRIHHIDSGTGDALLVKYPEFLELQMDLAFDASTSVIQSLDIEWKCKEGIVEHMETIVQEFVKARHLYPVKIVVHGPPAVGKSTIAETLGHEYYIPVVRARDALKQVIAQPVRVVTADTTQPVPGDHNLEDENGKSNSGDESKEDEQENDNEESNEDDEDLNGFLGQDRAESEFATALREKIRAVLQEKGRLPDSLMAIAVRWVLNEPKLRNRGYVLDGFPRTYTEAEHLFGEEYSEDQVDLDALTEEELDVDGQLDEESAHELPEIELIQTLLPTAVIIYDAPDDILLERVKAANVDSLEGEKSKTEIDPIERFKRRVQRYRVLNGPERTKTPINFFQHHAKLQTLPRTQENNDPIDMKSELTVLCPYIERGGKAFNYHPTPEELAEAAAIKKAEEEAQIAAEKAEQEKQQAEEQAQREAQEKEAQERLAAIALHEANLLEERSLPIRNYLMETIVPDLSEGLLEVCKVQPNDPVEYLAQFLFRRAEPANDEEVSI